MKRRLVRPVAVVCCLCLSSSASMAQTPAQTPQQATASPAASLSTPERPILEDSTPVKLRISQTISSADAKEGQQVDLKVLEEVWVSGLLVIPKGGIAWATVTEAQAKRRMGRAGKLNINIDAVRLANGQKVALRAVKEVKGGGHQGAMTGAIVATSLVVLPAAPLFLLTHGKDITIPEGTEITAFINGNAPLDPAKFQAQPSAQAVSTTGAAANVKPTEADVKVKVSATPAATPAATPVPAAPAPAPANGPSDGKTRVFVTDSQSWETRADTASTVRWQEGTASSDKFFSGGLLVKTIASNGLVVSASLNDTGWKMRADIMITNKTDQRIDVIPDMLKLDVIMPKAKSLSYQNPEELVKSIDRRTRWANAFSGMAAGLANQTATSHSSTSGSFDVHDSSGDTAHGTYDGTTTTTTTSPDHGAQQRASEQQRINSQNAASTIEYLNRIVLRRNTLMSGQNVSGAVFFSREKNHDEVVLRVPVGNTVFEFPFRWLRK